MSITIVASGRVGKEIKSGTTTTGQLLTKFSIASSQVGTKEPVWLNVTAWGKTAEIANNLKTGGRVVVHGQLKQDYYTDQQGQEKKSNPYINATLIDNHEPRETSDQYQPPMLSQQQPTSMPYQPLAAPQQPL